MCPTNRPELPRAPRVRCDSLPLWPVEWTFSVSLRLDSEFRRTIPRKGWSKFNMFICKKFSNTTKSDESNTRTKSCKIYYILRIKSRNDWNTQLTLFKGQIRGWSFDVQFSGLPADKVTGSNNTIRSSNHWINRLKHNLSYFLLVTTPSTYFIKFNDIQSQP